MMAMMMLMRVTDFCSQHHYQQRLTATSVMLIMVDDGNGPCPARRTPGSVGVAKLQGLIFTD